MKTTVFQTDQRGQQSFHEEKKKNSNVNQREMLEMSAVFVIPA